MVAVDLICSLTDLRTNLYDSSINLSVGKYKIQNITEYNTLIEHEVVSELEKFIESLRKLNIEYCNFNIKNTNTLYLQKNNIINTVLNNVIDTRALILKNILICNDYVKNNQDSVDLYMVFIDNSKNSLDKLCSSLEFNMDGLKRLEVDYLLTKKFSLVKRVTFGSLLIFLLFSSIFLCKKYLICNINLHKIKKY